MPTTTPSPSDRFRTRLALDREWAFRRWSHRLAARLGLGAEPERTVDLPHCWNEDETFRFGSPYSKAVGAYRREIEWPEVEGDGVWSLEAGGFYGLADVRLDGRRLARRLDGSYLGFRLDLDDEWVQGTSRLEIRVTNRCPRWVLPGYPRRGDPDFVLYGGLSGGVRLVRRPLLRLDETGTRIDARDVLGERPRIALGLRVVNGSSTARRCRLRGIARDADGETRAAEERDLGTIAAGEVRDATLELEIEAPRRWSDRDPHVYVAEALLLADGEPIDGCSKSFGLRTAEFRPDEGFFLNGERVELRGANRHQSMPGFGNALPDDLHRRDAEMLEALGLNLVRLAHYPQHPLFLDACDRLGLMVYAEIATWKSVRGGRWARSAREQMRRMILRDRHHPSVILWGLGNESRHRKTYLELRRIARDLDPTRPVIYAENHLYRARRQGILGIPDVWGINYELDVLEEARAASGLRNVLASECMNHPRSRRGDRSEEATQLDVLERDRRILEADPAVAGFAIWAFADYATEHRGRVRRLPGLFDAWRQPKMAASLFAAWFGGEPVLEIFGDWGERAGDDAADERTIHVVTNSRDVRLELDGKIVGHWPDGERHDLRIAPVEAPLSARGIFEGRPVEAVLPWHGAAARVRIAPEAEAVEAASRGTVAFAVRVEDAAGHGVGAWNGPVGIRIEGPGRLRSWEPGGTVEVSRGTGRGFVTATGGEGRITLRATVEGLDAPPATVHCVGDERPRRTPRVRRDEEEPGESPSS